MRWLVAITLVAMSADAAPAPAKQVRDAALLFMPATRDGPHRDPALRQFQPLLCSIDGKLITGMRCANLVPAHAVIRVLGHDKLTVNRARAFKHPDGFSTADFRSPYVLACCNYKGCDGKTIQYDVASDARASLDDGAQIAVWPADGDVAIEPGTGPASDSTRARDRITKTSPQLLVTTHIDHDGILEYVVYAPDINNYGIAVTVDAKDEPIYSFGCGDG
jgi:hypothetical protein